MGVCDALVTTGGNGQLRQPTRGREHTRNADTSHRYRVTEPTLTTVGKSNNLKRIPQA